MKYRADFRNYRRHANKVIPVRNARVTVRPVKFPTYGCFAPKKLIYKINKVNLIQ